MLAGTWEALITGNADLAVGVDLGLSTPSGVKVEVLGSMGFVFAVAPHHPLATHEEPVTDSVRMRYRAVAVADSAQRLAPITINVTPIVAPGVTSTPALTAQTYRVGTPIAAIQIDATKQL